MKVTEKKFFEALESNPDANAIELAQVLDISVIHYYRLRKKYRDKIRDAAIEYSKIIALDQVKQLEKHSKKEYAASNSLLEIAKVRTKDSTFQDNSGWKITIEKIEPVKTDQK